MFDSLHEECGVFAIYAKERKNVARSAYYALYALQHRGQESCGVAVNDDGIVNMHKSDGLVGDVFTPDVLAKLGEGNMAVGHVRYSTTGDNTVANAQPLVVNHIKGVMTLAHNGNLTNDAELREELELKGSIFHSTSDTEVISYLITHERLTSGNIEQAVLRATRRLKGAFSLVVMSPTKLIATRDKYGFRPLVIGKKGDDYLFVSETCALDTLDAQYVREVEPGELVYVDRTGELHSIKDNCTAKKTGHCVFELLYFARPDSYVEGCSVHEARLRSGRFLAKEHPAQADIVIGVPDSGLDAAMGFARESGIPYGTGFIKNRYIGRTFIQPTQAEREDMVRIKINAIKCNVEGKRVVMIDDSIVRGTTCARIVRLLRDAGAKEVHVRSSAPKFLYPCFFGTDIDSQDHLIAWNHTTEEICKIIGADSLGFLNKDSVLKIAGRDDIGFCRGCFTGEYPEDPPQSQGKNRYSVKISQSETPKFKKAVCQGIGDKLGLRADS